MFLTTISFIETDGIFAYITGFHSKIQVLKTLADRTSLTDNQKKKIRARLNKINRLAKTRNNYVHHTWWLDEDTKKTVLMNSKFKPGDKKYLTNVNAGNINNHNNAVQRWNNSLVNLLVSLRGTYLGKSYEPIFELLDHPQDQRPQSKSRTP